MTTVQTVTIKIHRVKNINIYNTYKTSKSVDPLTPLTLIYDSVTLPIMCKCMYRKS